MSDWFVVVRKSEDDGGRTYIDLITLPSALPRHPATSPHLTSYGSFFIELVHKFFLYT